MQGHYDTVVVGGGQAGLAVGQQLAEVGRDFVILDAAGQAGDAWRRRWRSLHLFTPAGIDGLPGMAFPAPRNHRPSKDEMAEYLREYAAAFELPVRTGHRVERVARRGTGFVVRTAGKEYTADHVVVATGPYSIPRTPPFAAELADDVQQLHSADYVHPGQLADGPVLVVGAGNSGGEIALDLTTHHQVWLSGRSTGHLPGNLDAALYCPVLRIRTDRGPGRLLARRLLGRGTPLVGIGPRRLTRTGVGRVPRVVGTRAGLPLLADCRVLDVRTVIWCTGLRPDLTWLDVPVVGEGGEPIQERGRARALSGLYFVGMRYQTTLGSGIIAGCGRDARHVVAALDLPPPRRRTSKKATSMS